MLRRVVVQFQWSVELPTVPSRLVPWQVFSEQKQISFLLDSVEC